MNRAPGGKVHVGLYLAPELLTDVERIRQGHLTNKVSEDDLFSTAFRIAETKGVDEANRWLVEARHAVAQPKSVTGVCEMLIREAINLRREKAGEPSIESSKPAPPEVAVPLTAAERKLRADALTLESMRAAAKHRKPVKLSK